MRNMHKVYYLFLAFLLMHSNIMVGQGLNNLDKELERIGTNTALIIPSEAIDEYPIWSPDSSYIAANIMGKWYKVDLRNIKLEKGTWRDGQIIGVPQSGCPTEEMKKGEVEDFKRVSKNGARTTITKSSTKVELRSEGMGTSLIVTKKNMKPVTLWITNLENCHSLVLSPDQQYVAFLCELNGLVIMRVQ